MGWREFILYHFSVPNHKHKDTQQFILTQCFHIFLLFSIGGAKKTKNGAKLSIGLDINMEVLLQHVRHLIFAICCGLYLSFKCGVLILVLSIKGENPEVHNTSLVCFTLSAGAGRQQGTWWWGLCVLRVTEGQGPSKSQLLACFVWIPNWIAGHTPAGNQEIQQTLPHRYCVCLCQKQRFYG